MPRLSVSVSVPVLLLLPALAAGASCDRGAVPTAAAAADAADGGAPRADLPGTGVPPVSTFGRPCTDEGWCWHSALSTHLRSVWGSGPHDVYIAGDAGLLLHYDGSRWRVLQTETTRRLTSVFGGGGHVFALGRAVQAGPVPPSYDPTSQGLALHYLGAKRLQEAGTDRTLEAGWASTTGEAVAAGVGGIMRYAGGTWKKMSAPGGAWPRAVWGAGPAEIYVAGSKLLRYDGTKWSELAGTGGAELYGVWGSGAAERFAVGAHGVILHRRGGTWTWTKTQPGGVSILSGVWGSGPHDVYAVGDSGTILRFDGATWSRVAAPTKEDLNAVWGSSRHDIYAVGRWGTVLHYDGQRWSLLNGAAVKESSWVDSPLTGCGSTVGAGTVLDLWAIWAGGPDDVVAAGCDILHYDGTGWTRAAGGPSGKGIWTLWGSGPNVVGAGHGAIYHGHGSSWSPVIKPQAVIYDLWGAGPSDVFAVGEEGLQGGRVLHYDGSKWTPMEFSGEGLGAVWGSGPKHVLAFAEWGRKIYRYDGSKWTLAAKLPQSSPTGFSSAWGSGPDDVFVVGAEGGILHFDGASWTPMSSGTKEHLEGVSGSGASNVYAVGRAGTILRYDGSSWRRFERLTGHDLFDVSVTPAGSHVFAVGTNSTILGFRAAASGR